MGEPMTFVRFDQCSFGCHYCDTPESFTPHKKCRIEQPPRSEQFIEVSNPMNASSLNEWLTQFSDSCISITGGEPLEQADFLSEWLPTKSPQKQALLETNGLHPDALNKIVSSIDIISMDLKLPSSTGVKKPVWGEHEKFLEVAHASGKEFYVKIVLTSKTSDREIEQAINLVNKINRYIPVILQPVSPTLTFSQTLSDDRMNSIQRTFQAYLPDVRVIPQMHKVWGIL